MKLSDKITMCLRNLFRRPMRTLLTVIGVVVGTCSIVVMVSIAIGMNESQQAMLESMGDLTIIEVYSSGSRDENGKEIKLNDANIAQIQAMPGVVIATPFYRFSDMTVNLVAGRDDRYSMGLYSAVGVYPEALEALGYEFLEGRTLKGSDPAYSVVIGENAAYSFVDTKKKNGDNMVWPEVDPVTGQVTPPFTDYKRDDWTLKAEPQEEDGPTVEKEITVVGRIKEDYSKGYETSQGIYMNIDDMKELEKEWRRANNIRTDSSDVTTYNNVNVKVASLEDVKPVQEQIEDMGFSTWSMESVREPMQEESRRQQLMLGGLGAISLFVAAIGITNTMIMSIYERTREIGIMKVLGCQLGNIRTVFLMEAGCIGLMGGILGVALSYGVSYLLNTMTLIGMGGAGGANMSVIPLWLVAGALAFSTMVGLVSGFYPANRAVKISAMEAIKHG